MDEVSMRDSGLRPSVSSELAPVLSLLPSRFHSRVLGEK